MKALRLKTVSGITSFTEMGRKDGFATPLHCGNFAFSFSLQRRSLVYLDEPQKPVHIIEESYLILALAAASCWVSFFGFGFLLSQPAWFQDGRLALPPDLLPLPSGLSC